MTAPTLVPGPKGRPFFGLMHEFRRDPLELLPRLSRDYGDLVRLQLGPYTFYMLNDPDMIEQVLVTQNKLFTKGRGLESTHFLLGQGLLTSEGDFWRRQRRLAQPAFHRERIFAYAETMVGLALEQSTAWQDGATCDINREMMELTLKIAARTLFSADVATAIDKVGTALDISMEHFMKQFNAVIKIPDAWPTPENRRAARAVAQLEAIIYAIIDERRQSGVDTGDLLSMLMQTVDEDGTRMTPKQLRDEVMTLLLAGHETTANTLSWTWYLLGTNPQAEATLHRELETVLGGRTPTVADLPRLPYVEAVINEALRVYPPAWFMGRRSIAPFELGGHRFDAGTEVIMSQWVMHRHPKYFAEPAVFRPERWLDGLAKQLPRFAYFPFGGGPRVCIGQSFALLEAQLLLATLAQRFRFRVVPDHPVVPNPQVTLRPKFGIKVEVAKTPCCL